MRRRLLKRITPFRITDNVIDGVVLTFSEISISKLLETELRETIRNIR